MHIDETYLNEIHLASQELEVRIQGFMEYHEESEDDGINKMIA